MPASRTERGVGITRNVRVLGLVSFLTDASSEMLYPVVPLYLTEVLGAPMAAVGLIEGLAEATASVMKGVSGRMADRARRRLPFVFVGYGLGALSKPMLALLTSWPGVLLARVVDRTGKGLRGPARDAIIVESTAPEVRGRAFGVHRMMDTLGAVVGPLLGMAGLFLLHLEYATLFWLAAIPAGLSVLCIFAVRETPRPPAAARPRPALALPACPELRRFLAIIAVFSIGNSSNAFLLLRARDLGWSDTGVIGLFALYNLAYALAAIPAGSLSDRFGRRALLAAGLVASALVYSGFAIATTATWALALLPLYGIYAATFGSVGRAYIADLAPADELGAAMGAYQMITGITALGASLIAGALWSALGAAAPFALGSATSLLALALMLAAGRQLDPATP